MTVIQKQYRVIFIVLLCSCIALLTLILFSLHQQPIYIWDEALYANNSLEMAQHHQYLIVTNDGIADHYNSKPPLVLWLQALSFHFLLFTEFALRLPIFIALLGILFLFFYNSKRLPSSIYVAFIACFILLTTPGVIRPHVFLSGDLDGVLLFFASAICFIHLNQIHKKKITNGSILLLSLFFLFAYFTKSTASFLIVPSLFVSYLFAGLLVPLLKNKFFYVGLIGSFLLIAFYYLLREHYDHGYCGVVYESEFKRYVSNVMSWHNQPFTFYFKNIATRFNPFYLIVTGVLLLPFYISKQTKHKQIVSHLLVIILIYLLVISIPLVKLEWYDAPIYPLWSFALAIMLHETISLWFEKIKTNPTLSYLLSFSILILIGYSLQQLYWNQLHAKRDLTPQEMEASLLKEIDTKCNKQQYTVLMDVEDNKLEHFAALNFYIKSFKLNQHKTVTLKRFVEEVKPSDTLIVVQQNKIDSLEKRFELHQILPNNKNYVSVGRK